jgi:hypothetical protein
VKEDVALYRLVKSYARLAERAFVNSPDGFEPNEVHDRVMETGREIPPPPWQKALDHANEVFGTKRAVYNLEEIVQRAEEGRVADLLLREDEGSQKDLLNLAALGQKIQASGRDGRSSVGALLTSCSLFFYSQIVGHRECSRDRVRADSCDGLVHLTGNHPFQCNVAVLNDNVNRPNGSILLRMYFSPILN